MIFVAFFIKLITISAPVLFKKPTPSQINLIKNGKKSLLKKLKNIIFLIIEKPQKIPQVTFL